MRVKLLFLFCVFMISFQAQASSQFTVMNIAVDMEGKNALQARENALNKARRDAFHILTKRLLADDERAYLPKAEDSHIAAMVNDFEINREKYSKNRYLASLNITFNQRAVHGYFGRYTNVALPDISYDGDIQHENGGVSGHLPQRQSTRLLLPWYGEGSDVTLWRDPNPWREAWKAWVRTSQGQDMNILMPMGDINDIQAFNPEKPLSFDQSALQRLLDRYGADQAIIAMADPLPNGMIRVSLYQSTNMTPRFVDRVVTSGGTMKGIHRFLPAIHQSAQRIQDVATQAYSTAAADQGVADTPSFSVDNTITNAFEAEIKLANIQQWIGIKQSLAMVSAINDIQVKSLSAGRAVIAFRYAGDSDALRRDLSQRGLNLYANPTQMSGASPYVIVRQNG